MILCIFFMFSVSFLEPWGPFLEARDLTFEDSVVLGNIFGAEYEKLTECHPQKYDIGRFLEVPK